MPVALLDARPRGNEHRSAPWLQLRPFDARPHRDSNQRNSRANHEFGRTCVTPGRLFVRMLWGPVRSTRPSLKSAGFILPCQPLVADRPPSGADWQHELKWDGYRLIARKDGPLVRLWTRTGTDYATCLDRIRSAVAALPVTSAVLDGEAVALGNDGCVNFGALRSLNGRAGAILIAYDLLHLNGDDIRREPLQLRRARLARLLSRAKSKGPSGLVLSEAIEGNVGETMFRQARLMGLQGIVSKRVGSPYVSGRTRAWLNTKNPDFERC